MLRLLRMFLFISATASVCAGVFVSVKESALWLEDSALMQDSMKAVTKIQEIDSSVKTLRTIYKELEYKPDAPAGAGFRMAVADLESKTTSLSYQTLADDSQNARLSELKHAIRDYISIHTEIRVEKPLALKTPEEESGTSVELRLFSSVQGILFDMRQTEENSVKTLTEKRKDESKNAIYILSVCGIVGLVCMTLLFYIPMSVKPTVQVVEKESKTIAVAPPLIIAKEKAVEPQPVQASQETEKVEAVVEAPAGLPVVLIADDMEDVRKLIKSFLKRLPIEMDFAESGAEAIAVAALKRPDIIIMDMHMPDMDGKRLSDMLHEASLKRIAIIGMTSSAIAEPDSRFSGILRKPVKKQELTAMVERLLSRSLLVVKLQS